MVSPRVGVMLVLLLASVRVQVLEADAELKQAAESATKATRRRNFMVLMFILDELLDIDCSRRSNQTANAAFQIGGIPSTSTNPE
jgi:hypothetical protein